MCKVDYGLNQVKRGEVHSDLLFTNMSMIQKMQFKIDQSHYDKVYFGSIDRRECVGEVLEGLSIKFNIEFLADYRARSISVSDVAVLHENSVDKPISAIPSDPLKCHIFCRQVRWSQWTPPTWLLTVISVPDVPSTPGRSAARTFAGRNMTRLTAKLPELL